MPNLRPEKLDGATYKGHTHDGKPMYITVNEKEGRPFEVFVRVDDPDLFEWMTALTVMITRCLRHGDTLAAIADELMEVHSPKTRHFVDGGKGEAVSLAARIGTVLKEHRAVK